MRWSEIDFQPSPRKLRQFAGLCVVGLAALGIWRAWALGEAIWGGALLVAALVVGLLGLWRPLAMQPVFVSALVLAFPIGWTVSMILLAGIFVGLFLPLGWLQRCLGRDTLLLRQQRNKTTSYWQPKTLPTDRKRYLRPF